MRTYEAFAVFVDDQWFDNCILVVTHEGDKTHVKMLTPLEHLKLQAGKLDKARKQTPPSK